MNTEANKKEDNAQSLFDVLTELVESEELKLMIGNNPKSGAVHLVILRTLVL